MDILAIDSAGRQSIIRCRVICNGASTSDRQTSPLRFGRICRGGGSATSLLGFFFFVCVCPSQCSPAFRSVSSSLFCPIKKKKKRVNTWRGCFLFFVCVLFQKIDIQKCNVEWSNHTRDRSLTLKKEKRRRLERSGLYGEDKAVRHDLGPISLALAEMPGSRRIRWL